MVACGEHFKKSIHLSSRQIHTGYYRNSGIQCILTCLYIANTDCFNTSVLLKSRKQRNPGRKSYTVLQIVIDVMVTGPFTLTFPVCYISNQRVKEAIGTLNANETKRVAGRDGQTDGGGNANAYFRSKTVTNLLGLSLLANKSNLASTAYEPVAEPLAHFSAQARSASECNYNRHDNNSPVGSTAKKRKRKEDHLSQCVQRK
ncbi:uncharacterized protein V6R79_022489 [Siganus canaliculatus]